jgi:hypothetical protein
MKRVFFIGLMVTTLSIWGHLPQSDGGTGLESFAICSDRGVYIAGEWIRFRVFHTNGVPFRETGWSAVYYVELISPDGTSVSQVKLPLDASGASGAIRSTADLPSGTYYLKGYTRWMRNAGPSAYRYLSVEIINPYRKEVLGVDTISGSGVSLHPPAACASTGLQALRVSGSDGEGETGKVLELSFSAMDSLNGCISVVRKGAMEGQLVNQPDQPVSIPLKGRFLPETDGITLTGTVVSREGSPSAFAVVYLSSLGDGNEFYANYSDSAGRFYFALPEGAGKTEYFISASQQGMEGLDLRVDQDFCTEPFPLPSFPLHFPGEQPSLLQTLSINAQIRSQYQMEGEIPYPVPEPPGSYFYGTPGVVIRFDDFIQLPGLEEYFTEVIPQVSLVRREGTRTMRVRGPHPDLQFFDPLLMVDGVAVFDVESVLSISPRYVERVEIVTAPYVRGNVTFGGIVHLITRDGNMGYMDLPSSGLLLGYQRFGGQAPEDPGQDPAEPGIPDVRNTVYWQPSVWVLPGQPLEISFRTPAEEGVYEVWFRGIDLRGNCIGDRMEFTVEQNQSRVR